MKAHATLAAAVLAVATVSAGEAAAQGMGGAQRLLRGVCVLWFKSGGDGAAVAQATEKFGFRPLYDKGKVVALNAPAQLADQGFTQVSFVPGGDHPARCGIVVEESGHDRTAEVKADLDAWAAQREPMWTWARASPSKGASGAAPLHAWETPTHVMTLWRVGDIFNANGPGSWSVIVEITRKAG